MNMLSANGLRTLILTLVLPLIPVLIFDTANAGCQFHVTFANGEVDSPPPTASSLSGETNNCLTLISAPGTTTALVKNGYTDTGNGIIFCKVKTLVIDDNDSGSYVTARLFTHVDDVIDSDIAVCKWDMLRDSTSTSGNIFAIVRNSNYQPLACLMFAANGNITMNEYSSPGVSAGSQEFINAYTLGKRHSLELRVNLNTGVQTLLVDRSVIGSGECPEAVGVSCLDFQSSSIGSAKFALGNIRVWEEAPYTEDPDNTDPLIPVSVNSTGTKNIKTDYGAVGNGINDDTAAIQSAISDCITNNYTLYWPTGTYLYQPVAKYKITGIFNYGTPRYMHWLGDTNAATGAPSSVIRMTTKDIQFLHFSQVDRVRMENIALEGPGEIGPAPSEFDYGLAFFGFRRCDIVNCSAEGFIGDAILMDSNYEEPIESTCQNGLVENCSFNNNGRGGLTIVSGTNIEIRDCHFGPGLLPEAPCLFPALHVEAVSGDADSDGFPDRYSIDTLKIHDNVLENGLALITNKHETVHAGDRNAVLYVYNNEISSSNECVIQGPGCGNVAIYNNTITSYFNGTGSISNGVVWLKGGSIEIHDNDIVSNTSKVVFLLTNWATFGYSGEQHLLIENNSVTIDSLNDANIYRIFYGYPYTTKTWDQIDCIDNLYYGKPSYFMVVNGGSTPVKILSDNEVLDQTISHGYYFGNMQPGHETTIRNVVIKGITFDLMIRSGYGNCITYEGTNNFGSSFDISYY